MGILSMQRVLNYGSFLQAYALKQLLLQNGADDVYFIDIEKGRSLAGFEQENSLLKKLFRAIVLLVQGQLPAKIREGFPSAPRKADSLYTVDLLHKKRPLHK